MLIDNVKMLSVKDIKEKLGISQRNAYSIFHSKNFPLIKFGSRLYVRQEAFLKWLERIEKGA